MNGWLNIYKEPGYSSAHLLNKIKKHFIIKKIGHLGTLDPLACGVLPVAVGEATKTINYIENNKKCYEFIIKWGEETDTYDKEGVVLRESSKRPLKKNIQKQHKK